MPNEWDAFVSTGQNAGQPTNEAFNEFTGGADAGAIASPEVMAARRQRRVSWRQRGFGGKLVAAARSAANSVPIAGPFLQDKNEPEIQEYRENQPITSFATDTAAAAAPFAAAHATRAGASALEQMFGAMPRAAISGAGIGGADAAARGDDPVMGAGLGAMFSTAGRMGARAISPRNPDHPQLLARNVADPVADIIPDMVPGGRRMNQFWQNRLTRQGREAFREEITDQQRQSRVLPNFKDLPPWARMMAGGVGANLLGAHPAIGIAGGLIAPTIQSATRRGVNKILQSKRYDKYLNNQVMTPERRSLMAAIAGQAAPEPETLTGDR